MKRQARFCVPGTKQLLKGLTRAEIRLTVLGRAGSKAGWGGWAGGYCDSYGGEQ